MSYIVLIFGPQRMPIAVEAFDCDTNGAAAERGRERAQARDGYGYEVWSKGLKVAASFSREPLTVSDDNKPEGPSAPA